MHTISKQVFGGLTLGLLLSLSFRSPVAAAVTERLEVSPDNQKLVEAEVAASGATIEEEISGMGFGPGVAAIYMFGDRPVDSAAADENSILRVTYESRARAGVVLEAHYSFGDPRVKSWSGSLGEVWRRTEVAVRDQSRFNKADNPGVLSNEEAATVLSEKQYLIRTKEWGVTVMTELGDNFVRSVGIGPVFSARTYEISVRDAEVEITPKGLAFNLALVALIEPEVKSLADGFEADKAVPAGTGANIPFDMEPRFGLAVIFSASW